MKNLNKNDIPWYGIVWKILLLIAVIFVFSFTTANAQIAGETCENPIVVSNLPFTDSGNTVDCEAVSSFSEGFEATTGLNLPSCWYKVGTAGTVYTQDDTGISGNRNLYMVDNAMVAMPPVNNASENTHMMVMNVKGKLAPDSTIEFGYLTDALDANSFVLISSVVVNSAITHQEFLTIPNGLPTGDVVFALRNLGTGIRSVLIDDVSWMPIPSCFYPSDVITTGLSTTTADIEWIAADNETSWNISWGAPGYTPGDADEISNGTASTTFYQISGLSADTSYDVYVQADCGAENGLSTWVGPLAIYTGYCIPTTTDNMSHIDGFIATGNGGQDIENTETGPSLDNNGYSDYTYLHALTGSPGSQVDFTINIGSTSFDGDYAGAKIWVDWDRNFLFGDQASGEEVYRSNGYRTSHSWNFTIPQNASGTYRLRVGVSITPEHGPLNSCNPLTAGEFEDYLIEVVPQDSCTTANAGILITEDKSVCPGESFTLEVEGSSPEADGLISQWASSTDGVTWVNIPSATTPTYTFVDGTQEETHFRFRVWCYTDNSFKQSNAVTISLNAENECYCLSAGEVIEPITNVNFGDIDNTSDAYSTLGYEDFTNQNTEVVKDNTYSIILKGNTNGNYTSYFTVFIDWNQNGVLDDQGEVYVIGSISNSRGVDNISVSGDIEVPIDAVVGNTRMRVVKNYDYALTNPCGAISYGQVEDYSVIVSSDTPGECEPPTNISFGEVTFTGNVAHVPVSWTAGSETQWELWYINTNDPSDNGFETVIDSPETTLHLGAEQEYGIQVRSICGDIYSDWTDSEYILIESPYVPCELPELDLTLQDATGGTIDCIELGEDVEYYVLATLSDGAGNTSYFVSANGGEAVEVNFGESILFGPFTIGTDVQVIAIGVQDNNCSVSASINSPVFCAPIYDCAELEANIGDVCYDADQNEGVIDEDCECVITTCDSPEISLNVVDASGDAMDCVEENGEYHVSIALSGGFGNDSYTVYNDVGDVLTSNLSADGTYLAGPYDEGVAVSFTVEGNDDDECSVVTDTVDPDVCVTEPEPCENPTVSLSVVDANGGAMDCVEEDGEYHVSIALSDGSGNDSYTVYNDAGDVLISNLSYDGTYLA